MNKKTFKIVGISILLLILLFFISYIISVIKISNSDAYEFAIEKISENQKVKERVGRIIEFDKYPTGKLRKNNAQIETNLIGEKGNARIILILDKSENSEWQVVNFYFKDL